ncbi:helix-turn-helix transcriptional regulator [Lysobacter capsici]|uniref:helix-turn-helix transcriptional regulator n=1 Tax=Lysobacter capsici TaxID=435897 RepID=UPI00398D25CB
MNIGDLLNTAIRNSQSARDADLARALGVSRQTISNWRVGRTFPDAVACARIADMTGVPLHQILGMVGEERAQNPEEKRVWRRLANMTASAAAIAIIALGVMLPMAPARASKNAQMPNLNEASLYTLCEVI